MQWRVFWDDSDGFTGSEVIEVDTDDPYEAQKACAANSEPCEWPWKPRRFYYAEPVATAAADSLAAE